MSHFSLLDYSNLSTPDPTQIGSIVDNLHPVERDAVAEMTARFESLHFSVLRELKDLNIETTEGKQTRILLGLLPAGSTGWSIPKNKTDEQRILTHFCDPRLAVSLMLKMYI